MQTLDFARRLEQIIRSMRLSELAKSLDRFFEAGANFGIDDDTLQKFTGLLFEAQHAHRLLAAQEETSALLQHFDLNRLFDAPMLAQLIRVFRQGANRDHVMAERAFWDFYYGLRHINNAYNAVRGLLVEPKRLGVPDQDAVLELELHLGDDERLSVPHLISILRSIETLFSAVAEIATGERALPRVTYLDSGSKITIAIDGLKEIVDVLAGAFRDVWRAIRDRKNVRLERDWNTISEGLAIVQTIRDRLEAEQIDTETARRLEHRVSEQMLGLLGAGVMIQDVEAELRVDAGQLLEAIRDRRLLTAGEADEAPAGVDDA